MHPEPFSSRPFVNEQEPQNPQLQFQQMLGKIDNLITFVNDYKNESTKTLTVHGERLTSHTSLILQLTTSRDEDRAKIGNLENLIRDNRHTAANLQNASNHHDSSIVELEKDVKLGLKSVREDVATLKTIIEAKQSVAAGKEQYRKALVTVIASFGALATIATFIYVVLK